MSISTTNKVTPTSDNKEDEIQEIMSADLVSSPMNKRGVLEQLINLKRSLLVLNDEINPPYKTCLYEYECYQKDISYQNFETFKANLKKKLSKDDVKSLAQRELQLGKVQMPILNFFAYFMELEVMEFIFELFSEFPIEFSQISKTKTFWKLRLSKIIKP